MCLSPHHGTFQNVSSPNHDHPIRDRNVSFVPGLKRLDLSGFSSSSVLCADCHCKIRIDKTSPIYGCARCKFYICSPCYDRPTCGHGHLLKAITAPKLSACSRCRYQSKKRRLPMYHCNVCKFKLCLGIDSEAPCCSLSLYTHQMTPYSKSQ